MIKWPKIRQESLLVILISLCASLIISCDQEVQQAKVPIGSSISSEEDPWARYNYEFQQIVDPKTGRVPDDIYEKERAYVSRSQRNLEDKALRLRSYDYNFIGPSNVGGRTRAFATDINDQNTLVAGGVSGGMWRSTNAGDSWARTSHPTTLNSATCLVQDTRPGKENTWYYGTGELRGNSAAIPTAPYRGDGIHKSVDGAMSWFPLSSTNIGSPQQFNSPFQYIWRLVVNHTRQDRDEIYAAAFGGIIRSLNGGEDWQTVLGDDLLDKATDTTDFNASPFVRFTDIIITTGGVFYAALGTQTGQGFIRSKGGIFRSTDGENWTEISPPAFPNETRRIVLAAAPGKERVLFFLIDGEPGRLFRYEESPDLSQIGRWTDLSANIPSFEGDFGQFDTQNSYNMAISVHPTNEDLVFIGGTNLYRSTDGFRSSQNTSWIGGYDPGESVIYPGHHPDQHWVVFSQDLTRMYTANDGGIFSTSDYLSDEPGWINHNNGYITSQFYTIAQDKDRADRVIGGLQDNGTYLSLNTASSLQWESLQGGDGGYAYFTKNDIYRYNSTQNGSIFRRTIDGGRVVGATRVDPSGGGLTDGRGYLFINPYVLDPNDNNRMYMAGGDIIWRNNNLNQIPDGSFVPTQAGWVALDDTEPDESVITALEISTEPANTLYYGTLTGDLFKVDEAHSAVLVSQINKSPLPEVGYIICIAIDPMDADHILVIYGNYGIPSVFRSVNGGETFEDISANLEQEPDGSGDGPSVRWAEIAPLSDGTYLYLVGTSAGLFSMRAEANGSTEWVLESEDLIGFSVIRMLDYRPSDGWLVVSTHGNGVFETTIDDALFYTPPVISSGFSTEPAFPNPFTEQVNITFSVPSDGDATVAILDATGRLISVILRGQVYQGLNSVVWNGTNNGGTAVANGTYFYRVGFRDEILGGKVILNR